MIQPLRAIHRGGIIPTVRFGIIDNPGDYIYLNTQPPSAYHIKHTTCLFRKPKQLVQIADYVKTHFPNGAPIYCYGCSDGSEPYSLAIILIRQLGLKQAQKYFPIVARDISPTVIMRAKSGYLTIPKSQFNPEYITNTGQLGDENNKPDLSDIHLQQYFQTVKIRNVRNLPWLFYIGGKYPHLQPFLPFIEKYFLWGSATRMQQRHDQIIEKMGWDFGALQPDGEPLYRVDKILRQAVQFEHADLYEDLERGELSPQPNVLLFNAQLGVNLTGSLQKAFLTLFKTHLAPGTLIATDRLFPETIRPYNCEPHVTYTVEGKTVTDLWIKK